MRALVDYQNDILSHAIYPRMGDNFAFPAQELAREVSATLSVLKVVQEEHDSKVGPNTREKVREALGGALCNLVVLCWELNIDVDDLMDASIDKLDHRARYHR